MSWTKNEKLNAWIQDKVDLCKPDDVYLCDGSDEEFHKITSQLVSDGVFVPLKKRPNSFWCHSDPEDVARVEGSTYICSENKEDAGPTNNWYDPKKMRSKLLELFKGCMRGRTMYIIPYCMGPIGSEMSIIGIELTDSPYVVANMKIMARMGKKALDMLGTNGHFVPGLHSVGVPLKDKEKGPKWPCQPDQRHIVHFPETKEIFSFGSGYGGNALLGKKCLALRIASVMARENGWLAEHMLILGLTNPEGEKKYVAAAFPSACGKTNLAMITPSLPGWKAECVGDDIAWMHIGEDGQLYAINPEYGYFGVAPGTSMQSNPIAMKTIEKDTIFTNVAMTDDGDVWWERMTDKPPEKLTDWKNNPWTPASKEKAAHPNSRFTAVAKNCPIVSPKMDDPNGVPISAIFFGGRRKSVEPLIYEAFSWQHGTFLGAATSSEMTAAAKGKVGELRHDPFSMLPFCGYNMGDYFAHWLSMEKPGAKLPKIFHVNWFQQDENKHFLWPGFGDNIRVMKWALERCEGKVDAEETPIGYIPKKQDLDLSGINFSDKLLEIDTAAWKEEVKGLREYFKQFGKHLPKGIEQELNALEKRL